MDKEKLELSKQKSLIENRQEEIKEDKSILHPTA